MPTSKEQKKKNQEIEKKIRIALIDFTMKTNQACKSKVESEFAYKAFESASYLVNTILEFKDNHNTGIMYKRMSDYLAYKKLQNECNKGNRYFPSCDSIRKLFNDLLETVEKNDPLRIDNFECRIYRDVKKNVDKILKHSDILEKREDVLIERCRKCLNLIFEKKQINNTIVEKLISWLEKICTIRFGDKAKWPKNKKNGLAGLANILSSDKGSTRLKIIITYILKNINKRSCLWPLVDISKKLNPDGEGWKEIEEVYKMKSSHRLLIESLTKFYDSILNVCKNIIKANEIEFPFRASNIERKIDSKLMLMLKNLNTREGKVRNKYFSKYFQLNKSPNNVDIGSNLDCFLRCFDYDRSIEMVFQYFFYTCYTLGMDLNGKNIKTFKSETELFQPVYDAIKEQKSK